MRGAARQRPVDCGVRRVYVITSFQVYTTLFTCPFPVKQFTVVCYQSLQLEVQALVTIIQIEIVYYFAIFFKEKGAYTLHPQ
jgi:hypothetical protein